MKNTKEVRAFKWKFRFLVIIVDFITVLLTYYIMPLVQGFPPNSENLAFQKEVLPFTHIEQYMVVFALGITAHLVSFKLLMGKIYKYLNKYYRKEKISYNEIYEIRKTCINIPYKVSIFQMILIVSIGIFFNFIMLASAFAILKFTLMIIAIASVVSIAMLVGTQKILYGVIMTTYEVTDKYEKNVGYRITNSQNLLLQVVPFIAVVLIVISLIGYSKVVEQEGLTTANYYKAYLDSKNINQFEVNEEALKTILNEIPKENEEDYYFIINPNDEIYVSDPNGSISDFVLKYRDYFYDKNTGMLYEKFESDEQLYALQLTDTDGNTWYIGFKFHVIDFDLLIYFAELIVVVIIAFSILLYVWSKNMSNNLIRTTNRLKDIVTAQDVDDNTILPIASNDEFGDLAYYYNKIQEFTKNNITQIHDNQETLMENERLASLGQLIGGIAHNLKTPIMSISGAAEGLNDLIKEYDASIDDPEVTPADHHDIAKDMFTWTDKIKTHTEYMSDVITAVKGQAVTLSADEQMAFTVEELIKRVNILMKHELKNAIIYLNVSLSVDNELTLSGDVNSLVQVINNMISNSIQAYNGQTDKNIDMKFVQEGENLVISITDYAGGLPQNVQDKLFKEMVTTKGKNGTGLGLYMSYSTIKARFNGNITFETKKGEGTTFYIILPLI